MNPTAATSSPPINNSRRLSSTQRTLRAVWMRGFLPSVLLLMLGFVSVFSVSYWQGENAPPFRRMQVTAGGIIFCWETTETWAFTSRPRIALGTNFSVNGQRRTYYFAWYFGPLDVSLGVHPLRLTAGNIQVSFITLAAIAAVPAAIQTIRRHLRRKPWQCSKCGYDLRKTPSGLPCPECGSVRALPTAI
jgi:hypothetical protein